VSSEWLAEVLMVMRTSKIVIVKRKGIPNSRVSFNLFNEPTGTTEEKHDKVIRYLVDESGVSEVHSGLPTAEEWMLSGGLDSFSA
jgi:hypothetical protein